MIPAYHAYITPEGKQAATWGLSGLLSAALERYAATVGGRPVGILVPMGADLASYGGLPVEETPLLRARNGRWTIGLVPPVSAPAASMPRVEAWQEGMEL